MGSQQYCLRWNNHQTAVLSGFAKLLENEALVDVTIACGGIRIKAHKVVLSACSPYFQEIFEENPCKHPVIILKGFTFHDLKSMVDFMYKGEVNVDQKHLADFLKTAEELQISGLVDQPSSGDGIDSGAGHPASGLDDNDVQRQLNSSADEVPMPIQHDHRGGQIGACTELRERLRSSEPVMVRSGNAVASVAASVNVNNDYGDGCSLSDPHRIGLIAKQEPHDADEDDNDDGRINDSRNDSGGACVGGGGGGGGVVGGCDNEIDIDEMGNDHYNMDSDCDGSLPMCPVDAELHVKEEVEILEEDLSVVNDASQLLLERLTRPQSSIAPGSDHATITPVMSITRSFDIPSASGSQGTSASVQMLESHPGHSAWGPSGPTPGPSRPSAARDPAASSTGTESAKRKKRRHPSETGSDAGDYLLSNSLSNCLSELLSSSMSTATSPQQRSKAPIKCPHCPQQFSSSTNRNRHIKHMHFLKPNERNFACTHCDRAYRRKDNLTYHLRICHPEHPVDVELLRT